MKQYDFTVIGTAATVVVLRVPTMPEAGKSTPVFEGALQQYSNGGMGFNICAGLAKLGANIFPVLTYADYRQHDYLYRFAAENGMPTEGIMDPPEQACGTTIMIQDAAKSHMTLVTEYAHRLANSSFYGFQQMPQRFFADSKLVVLTAPMAMNTQTAIDAIRESGKPLAFSMRKDLNALPPDKLRQILALSDYLFANEAEIAFIVESFGLTDIRALFDSGKLRYIIETLGEKGSRVYYRQGQSIVEERVPIVPPQCSEIETVGAGDGYVCGFLYGMLRGRGIRECALLGAALSSFVLEKEGSVTNLPSESQLLERFNQFIKKETI